MLTRGAYLVAFEVVCAWLAAGAFRTYPVGLTAWRCMASDDGTI